VASLLAFNVGVELGQLLVLLLILPPLALVFRHATSERVGTIVLSAVVAHAAWHWMIDRATILAQFRVEWPALDASLAASTAGWLVIVVVAIGALRLLRALRNAVS
jgi:hypothetical protein